MRRRKNNRQTTMDTQEQRIFNIVSEEARALGVRAFVIGGYVRDTLLGTPGKDIDIVVEGSGIALAERVAARLRTKVTVYRRFGTAMLKKHGIELEFVGARKESYREDSRNPIVESGTLEEDQLRRDFTINAMSFSLQAEDFGRLIDPFGGERDLEARIIRTPLDPDVTYSDDPLRMIRAIRFACRLEFRIEDESFEAIRRNRERISILSRERIAEELNKILMTRRPSYGFQLLFDSGLLELILPQVARLKGVEMMEGKGHKDNFAHSIQVLDHVAAQSDDLWLRWAALLHDIGKPRTKKFEPGVGWTFHSHDFIGAKMIPDLFRQLKLPQNEKMKYVQKLVSLHLRPIALVQDTVTDSAVRRLLFDAGDDIDDLMTLCGADITSKNEATVRKHRRNFELVRQKLVEVEAKDAIRNFKPPVDGDLIMRVFGLTPGPQIGIIKETIRNAILDGAIGNRREEALPLMMQKGAELGLTPLCSLEQLLAETPPPPAADPED